MRPLAFLAAFFAAILHAAPAPQSPAAEAPPSASATVPAPGVAAQSYFLLDTLSGYTTPTGSLLDQGVSIWCNQCATGAHSFSNVPWILTGTANGYFKKGQFVTVGSGNMPGGKQDGKGGDGSVSGVNKMLNTVLTGAGVPTDNFGDASLPKGIFSELVA